MVRKATQKQLYFNVFIGLVILYFVLYRVLQQKTWNDALAAIRTGDVNRTHSQVSNDLVYAYSPPTQSGLQTTKGREFTADPALISTLSIPPTTFFQLNPDTLRQFVFVTAVDTSHFEELRDCVGSIQQHFPGYHIHLYDLGMTSTQITEVRGWCNVVYHKFDTSAYPQHVGRIKHKAFKFLVIQDILSKHGAAFWVDASFRAMDSIDQWQDVFDVALDNGGIVLVYNETGDHPLTNFAWSDPYMFQFLPTDMEIQKKLIQQCSCAMLIYNTEFVFHRVLWWMYLCSLERECITRASGTASIDWQKLDPDELRRTFIVHRYDQSAINTILGNEFAFDQSKYTTIHNHNVITRNPSKLFDIETCS